MILLLLASVIYPEPPPLHFDHQQHLEEGCSSCHPAVESIRASEELRPPEARCLDCHADWMRPEKPACERCHPGFEPPPFKAPRPQPPGQRPQPSPVLRFSHKAHLGRGSSCADCHLAQEGGYELPPMRRCMACHSKEEGCGVCHLRVPGGQLKTQLPGGLLKPQDHQPGWSHTVQARLEADRCHECHPKRDCLRCHAGHQRPIDIHPADYLLLHRQEARALSRDCSLCHRSESFCQDCHLQAGAHMGGSTSTPSWSGQGYHPEGFVDLLGGTPGPLHHRYAARRNLRECVSCHREADCIRCHGLGASARIRANPHPPSYDCRDRLKLNPRGCLKCHESMIELERRCRREPLF